MTSVNSDRNMPKDGFSNSVRKTAATCVRLHEPCEEEVHHEVMALGIACHQRRGAMELFPKTEAMPA